MIKLKKLIKEHAWDRNFGEPLPTLKDIAEKHTVKINERGPEHEEVFGVEIVRVRQNGERVAYRVLYTSGRRTIGNTKEYSIEKLGDDKAFTQAKKEALKTVRGWK
jgi:nucleoside-triphosphatase THEP1